jgi:DNA end-binding protein Ku
VFSLAATHKGAISFGLVHIPVALHTATQDDDLHFNQLCREDGSRVKYKKVCSHCGKEVSAQDIVRGFEFEKGKYVTMTEEDFEKAKTPKDRSIQILHFAVMNGIRPIYFDKTYHAVPESGGDKAYELLRKAMWEEGKVAIAKTVMGQSEKLLCLIPTEKGILAETLFFYSEVKEMPKEPARPELSEAEVTMAKTLIQSMIQEFEPQKYHDEYQQRLRAIIEAKIQGQEITQSQEEEPSNIINIMEALQASLKQVEADREPPKKPRGRKKTAS